MYCGTVTEQGVERYYILGTAAFFYVDNTLKFLTCLKGYSYRVLIFLDTLYCKMS